MDPTGVDATNWRVIVWGALAGLSVIVPVTVVRAVLDRQVTDMNQSGWVYPLFVLILAAYVVAGWVAGSGAPRAPLTHGALAGLGAVVLWVPIRIVIWAVREQGRGLVSGDRAALPPGQVFGALVISVGLGMLGGVLGARARRRADDVTASRSAPG
ncbi:MAG TPA: hypothetical protein VLV81_03845 [Acidimicrobiia bacterium]|nr:hypothetical protein [Acidimicrobiia bacterium]